MYQPKNEAERGVIASYMGLETASVGHDAPNWGPHVAEEFVAASSYSNKLLTKTERMADLAKSQMAGLAPTPVVTMRLVDFGDTVVMLSKQQPDKGKPLHITRVWTKRDGNWVIVVAFPDGDSGGEWEIVGAANPPIGRLAFPGQQNSATPAKRLPGRARSAGNRNESCLQECKISFQTTSSRFFS